MTMSRAERYSTLLQAAQLVVIAIGLGLTYYQVHQANQAIRNNSVTFATEAWLSTATHVAAADKLFIEYPEHLPYFTAGVEVPEGDAKAERAKAISLYILDYLDAVLLSQQYMHEHLPDSRKLFDVKIWETYVSGMFQWSPILCKTYAEFSSSYAPPIGELAKLSCKKASPTRP
jgi:hypothetical protein